ncbi:GumC family protein, partial [Methylobacterium trifolii]
MLERSTGPSQARGRQAPAQTPKVGDPGDITYLIAVVRRWRRLILGFVLAGVGIALLYLMLATPQYRATARILIDFRRLTDIGQDQLAINSKVNDSAVDSQATIMTSEGVIRAVIRSLKLDADPEFRDDASRLNRALALVGLGDEAPRTEVERERNTIDSLSKRLLAQRVGVSYVIELRFVSEDAAKATRIVNALAAAYVNDQLAAKQEAAGSANTWYKNRVAELQGQANEAEKAAVAFRTRNRIMLADGHYVDEQQLNDLSTRLITAQTEQGQAQAKLDQIDAILRNGGEGAVADEFQNNLITALRQKMADINRRIADGVARNGAEHETVERARSDLRAVKASLTEEFQRIAAGYRSTAAVARLNQESITRSLDELAGRSAEAQASRVELAQLQSFSDTYKTMRDAFLSRFAEAAQEQSYPVTEARIVSEAAEPTRPASPNWYKALPAGLAVGFGLGFIVALGRDVLSRRVRDRR